MIFVIAVSSLSTSENTLNKLITVFCAFSSTVTSRIALATKGTSSTGAMLTVNISVTVKPLDVPSTLISTEPDWFSNKSIVRISPSKLVVTRLESLLVTIFVIAVSSLSGSLNTLDKSVVMLSPSSSISWSAIALATTGASSTSFTITVNVSVTVWPFASAWTVISALPDCCSR